MAKTKKELAEEEIGEPVEVEVKRPLDKIVPIRLSADHWAELYRYARELGVGPTTLARMWILEKLALVKTVTSGAYARGAVPLVPNWVPPAPQRLTFNQFMEKVLNVLPEDVKHNWEELAERSMLPPDAEKPEDLTGLVIYSKSLLELTQQFYRGIATLMGVEIVDEEAKAGEPKSEDRKSEVKS